MALIMIVLLALISTISAQTTMPQCRCDQINTCMQKQQQMMQTCAMSNQCMKLLGGNSNQVSTCMAQRMQRNQMTMDSCMKMKMANMACTNSTTPMQVHTTMMNQQPTMMTDNSAMGQFYSCVQNCMMPSSPMMNGGAQQSMMKSGMDCMQQLGCTLDMNMLSMDMIVMTAENCMMMNMPMMMPINQNSMMMSTGMPMNMMNNQNSMMMMWSPAMMWLMPQDCTCLMNAGVQVMCNNMMNNNMMMNNNNMMMNNNNNMMMNNNMMNNNMMNNNMMNNNMMMSNRGRRSNDEE